MRNLQDATEKICELKGSLVAFDALMSALLRQMPEPERIELLRSFSVNAEVARTVLLHAPISECTVSAFEHDVSRMLTLLDAPSEPR